jgi:nucleoid-associated protein YgaU
MGLIQFIRDAGREMFKPDDPAEAKAAAIRREIDRLMPGHDLKVDVDGGKVKVSGHVPDQATKEKLMLIVGNTRHVEQVDDQLEPAENPTAAAGQSRPAGQAGVPSAQGIPVEQVKSRLYTVERGDTLSKIAKQFYGDASAYNLIFEANRPMLKDPDEIYPGQTLRIPDR